MESCYNEEYETYVEKIFFEKLDKCIKEKKLRETIKVSWMKDKSFYTDLSSKISYEFIHYSLHDISHSISILQYIYLLLGKDKIDELSVGDLWLLLESSYSHDIGMFVTYNELVDVWSDTKQINKIIKKLSLVSDSEVIDVFNYIKTKIDNTNDYTDEDFLTNHQTWPIELKKAISYIQSEYIRQNHPERSKMILIEMLKKYTDIKIENRLYNIVGTINHLHGLPFEEIKSQLPKKSLGFATDLIHPRLIAMLLRVGDALDIRNNRFDYWNIQYLGGLPKDSYQHYEKHRSVSEFLVDCHEVKIYIKSDDFNVCRTSRQWLDIIDKELNYMIRYWNSFAPEEIRGLYFDKIDLKVAYNNQSFVLDNFEYRLKTEPYKLMSLLTGKNIYKTKLVVFREYLQNAIDATKMKLAYDYYIEKNKLSELLTLSHKETFEEILPMNLKKSDYEKGKITLKIDVPQDRPSNILFIIKDQGIGMDENGLSALFNVGKGWSERDDLYDLLQNMPDWLKPTGGFGIGILSAFLLSDKVIYHTKSKKDPRYAIIIYSPNEGGLIEKISNDYYYGNTGTSIAFEVPFALLLKELNSYFAEYESNMKIRNSRTNFLENYKKQLSNLSDSDKLIDSHRRLLFVAFGLKQFIEELMVDIIFPISIEVIPIKYKTVLNVNAILNYDTNPTSQRNILWLNSLQTLVKYNIANISDKYNPFNTNIMFGYKGIAVENPYDIVKSPIQNRNEYLFLTIKDYKWVLANWFIKSIDIFNGKVENILDISRHNFIDDFDYFEVINLSLVKMFEKRSINHIDNKMMHSIKNINYKRILFEALDEFALYNRNLIDENHYIYHLLIKFPYDNLTDYCYYLAIGQINKVIKDIRKFIETINNMGVHLDNISYINNYVNKILNLLPLRVDKSKYDWYAFDLNKINIINENIFTKLKKIDLYFRANNDKFDINQYYNLIFDLIEYSKENDILDSIGRMTERTSLVKLLLKYNKVYCCYIKKYDNILKRPIESFFYNMNEKKFMFVRHGYDYYIHSDIYNNYCDLDKIEYYDEYEIFTISIKNTIYDGIENQIINAVKSNSICLKSTFEIDFEDQKKYSSIYIDFNIDEILSSKNNNKKSAYIINPFANNLITDDSISIQELIKLGNLYEIHKRFNDSYSFKKLIKFVYDCKIINKKYITIKNIENTYFKLIDKVILNLLSSKKGDF